MNKEDYFKYYIQGSDHYLIPKDIFEELFNEMNNWKEEAKLLKIQVSSREEVANKYKEVIEEIREYIKNNYHLNWYAESCYKDDLLEILDKGESNE